jgi:glycosyltransferase involved in cell wall biosynthesis
MENNSKTTNNLIFKTHTPYVSVIMPVHNYGIYIKEAIDSILNQTMPDFEFIIINDGSTDESSKIAHSYDDQRIHIVDFAENRGCYPARNHGMRLAKGKYLCVMDADDISLPKRLELQCDFLEKNTEIGLIGSAFRYMNDVHPVYRNTHPENIRLLLLRYCYLLHPTCMIKHSLVKKYTLYYNEILTYASDYAWQVKASSHFPISNINDILLLYRQHEHQISTKKSNKQVEFANKTRIQQLTSIGLKIESKDQNIIIDYLIHNIIKKEEDYIFIKRIIAYFIEINKVKKYYDQERLDSLLNFLLENCKTEYQLKTII